MLKREDAEIALIEQTYQNQKKICLSIRKEQRDNTKDNDTDNDALQARDDTIAHIRTMQQVKDDTIAHLSKMHKGETWNLKSAVDTHKSLYEKNKKFLKIKNGQIANIMEANDCQHKIIECLKIKNEQMINIKEGNDA